MRQQTLSPTGRLGAHPAFATGLLVFILSLSPLAAQAEPAAPFPEAPEYRVESLGVIRPEPASWVAQPAGFLAFGMGREVSLGGKRHPALLQGMCPVPSDVTGAASLGNFLYMGLRDTGLGILDASDSAHPVPEAPIPLTGSRFLPSVDGNILVVFAEGVGLYRFQIRDVHHGNPLEGVLPDFLPLVADVSAFAVIHNTAFIALGRGGVMAVNLSPDSQPFVSGVIETAEPFRAMCKRGDDLLAQGNSGALWVLGPSSTSPGLLSTDRFPPAESLFSTGRIVFGAGPGGVEAFSTGRQEAATISVSVGNTFFNPQSVIVAPGDTIQWNWVGGTHSTTSGVCGGGGCTPDGIWDSGNKASGSFSHKFDSAGSYPYHCKIHGSSMTGTVTVLSDPCTLECTASAAPAAGQAPLAVAFACTATATGCAGTPTYAWSFGDGASASVQNPDHTYEESGTYAWTLTVSVDGTACTRSGIVEAGPPCTLNCTASALPTVGPAPLTVAFSATSQQTFCPEFPTFIWDFGDGNTSTIPITTHTYAQVGTYAWTLTATAAGVTCVRIGEVSATGQIPGDCDGNMIISIGEVQQAINMFLGIAQAGAPAPPIAQAGAPVPPSCGVDCNGDGVVSIGEVQKVINAFLGLPGSC